MAAPLYILAKRIDRPHRDRRHLGTRRSGVIVP